jgi:hypothetical protein
MGIPFDSFSSKNALAIRSGQPEVFGLAVRYKVDMHVVDKSHALALGQRTQREHVGGRPLDM